MPNAANCACQRRYLAGPAARQANAPYLKTSSLRLLVLVASCPAGQAGLSVLPLMTAAGSPHAHPRARPPRHPPSGTHRRRQGRAQHRASRKVPAISGEAGAAQLHSWVG